MKLLLASTRLDRCKTRFFRWWGGWFQVTGRHICARDAGEPVLPSGDLLVLGRQ